MKKYLRLLLALLLVLAEMSAVAQTSSPHQLPSVLPPSPNAAELGRFGTIPVSLSTGAINYSIPLMTLSSGGLKLNIGLAYSAGGIRVDQIASRAGLGWILDAGGMVNRTVHGNLDELSDVAPVPSDLTSNDPTTAAFLDRATLNKDNYDTEPDIFSFNFNGYSGRFILNPADKDKIIFLEKSNLKIETDFSSGVAGEKHNIKITDPNGVKYYFGGTDATEESRSLTSGSGCGRTYDTGAQNAWYLTKMKDLNGDSIVFTYQPIQIEYETAASETNIVQDYATRAMFLSDGIHIVYPAPNSQTSCISSVINDGVYLDKIVTSTGEQVKFTYITRTDIDNEKLFSQIEYGLVGETAIKTFELAYDQAQGAYAYGTPSSNPQNNYRPYLISLQEKNNGLTDFKKHEFHYYHMNDMPARISYAQDSYGYFNGANNVGLLPAYSVSGFFSYTPADRSSNASYANYGMLSKVIYPTKGSDSLIYEGHSYGINTVGGARVKEVITHDPVANKDMVKSYIYKQYPGYTVGSGVPMREPLNYFSPVNMEFKAPDASSDIATYTMASSGGTSSAFAENGNHIAYTEVTEIDGTGGLENGGTVHKFNLNTDAYPTLIRGVNFPNMPFGITGLPAISEIYQLTFRTAPDASKVKQRETYTHTKSILTHSMLGYLGRKSVEDLQYAAQAYDLATYPIEAYWNYVDSVKTITYDIDGLNPVTELTENFYNDTTHLQLTSTRTTGSDGRLITKDLAYPHEMVTTSQDPTGVYAAMIAVNKIAPVIEEKVTLPSSLLVSKVKTNYYQFYTGLFLPQTVDEYNRVSSSYETRLRFLNYDTRGNLLSVAQENGAKINYVWSYKSKYPVAEIKDADYSAVVTALGGASLVNSFAGFANPDKATIDAFIAPLKTSFPNALISTYAYELLYGVSSVMDAKGMNTFYEYDDFQRLKLVKDQNGDIVKVMDYNYSNTPVYNTARSQDFTKDNCAAGGTGSSVTYTVAAGTYHAATLAGANALRDEDIAVNGQAYANANGTCTYYNVAKSGSFTRNNCGTGGTGSTLTFTIAAGTFTSTTSQADADNQAVAAVNSGGQAYANTNGTCTYHNVVKSGSFTRNNCGTGGTGSTVTYTIAAGTYTSVTSQADADNQAVAAVNSGGQAYANTNGTCTYQSVAKSGSFTRNNCGTGGTGSTVTYTIAAGTYSSTISQADADSKAVTAVNSGGQAYANTNGTCTYQSVVKSGSFTRNNCGTGGTGSTVTYTIAAGTYSSATSQADADNQAVAAVNSGGQAYANTNGTCTYYNVAESGSFTRNDCGTGGTGSTVTYTVAAGSYSSATSQADADNQAVAAVNSGGQAYANTNGTCTYYNVAKSGSFTRNNCGTGGTGSTVTYTIAAGTYSSATSQADADNQAVAAVNSGGQAYANTNGTCTYYNAVQQGEFTRNDCYAGGTPSSSIYSIAAGTYSSAISQADADNQALTALNAGGQAYANEHAVCTYISRMMGSGSGPRGEESYSQDITIRSTGFIFISIGATYSGVGVDDGIHQQSTISIVNLSTGIEVYTKTVKIGGYFSTSSVSLPLATYRITLTSAGEASMGETIVNFH